MVERARKTFTAKRLHRCQACGWRGWGLVTSDEIDEHDGADQVRPAPDLKAIDQEFPAEPGEPSKSPADEESEPVDAN